jgi:ubiquinone/menaquinone biosynthesis C-methylase UbiE
MSGMRACISMMRARMGWMAARISLMNVRVSWKRAPISLMGARMSWMRAPISLMAARVSWKQAPISLMGARMSWMRAPIPLMNVRVSWMRAPIPLMNVRVSWTRAPISLMNVRVSWMRGPIPLMKARMSEMRGPIPLMNVRVSGMRAPISSMHARMKRMRAPISLMNVNGLELRATPGQDLEICSIRQVFRQRWDLRAVSATIPSVVAPRRSSTSAAPLERLARRLLQRRAQRGEIDPEPGYDLWSATYDQETDNLLVALDEGLFEGLLRRVSLRGKVVIDVGCGTGRHWKNMHAQLPADLVGYDISAGMLAQLRRKYPRATVHRAGADSLTYTPDASCDFVVSTLTLCHVPDVEAAFAEWIRVLRPGGGILLTDFHPAASANGDCSFRSGAQRVPVKLYVHSVASLRRAAARRRLEILAFEEAILDDSMKPYYERACMPAVFERMKGMPLLYGVHFRMADSKFP